MDLKKSSSPQSSPRRHAPRSVSSGGTRSVETQDNQIVERASTEVIEERLSSPSRKNYHPSSPSASTGVSTTYETLRGLMSDYTKSSTLNARKSVASGVGDIGLGASTSSANAAISNSAIPDVQSPNISRPRNFANIQTAFSSLRSPTSVQGKFVSSPPSARSPLEGVRASRKKDSTTSTSSDCTSGKENAAHSSSNSSVAHNSSTPITAQADRQFGTRHPPPGIPPPSHWRKVLYEQQPYADNYVDPILFLQDLRENEHLQTYNYREVMDDSFAIVQQLSLVILFVVAFALVLVGRTSEYTLVSLNGTILAMTVPLYIKYQRDNATGPISMANELADFFRQVTVLGLLLITLTPMLQTLTLSYSNDTIVALTTISMFLNVLLTDYNYLNAYANKYQQNLSVNAAMFGTILMASRIQSPTQSGALIMLGTLCFSLSPILRHYIKRRSFTMHVALTFGLGCIVALALMIVPILAAIYVIVVLSVIFVVPWCFVALHETFKSQIHGPWDEARPTNSAAAAEWANAGVLT